MQATVLFAELEGVRPRFHATSFILLWIDQFGSTNVAAQDYDDLLRHLTPRAAEKVRRLAW